MIHIMFENVVAVYDILAISDLFLMRNMKCVLCE